MLTQLGSQISVNGIIKKLPEIRHRLSLTNTKKVTNKGDLYLTKPDDGMSKLRPFALVLSPLLVRYV